MDLPMRFLQYSSPIDLSECPKNFDYYCPKCMEKWFECGSVCWNDCYFCGITGGKMVPFANFDIEKNEIGTFYLSTQKIADKLASINQDEIKTIKLPNDFEYQGEIQDNKFCGKGKLIRHNRNIYCGDWVNGHQEGYGVSNFPFQNYEGYFIKGKRSGKGKLILIFDNNKRGIYTYEGEFSNNKKHGNGLLIAKGYVFFDGQFAHDCFYQGTFKLTKNMYLFEFELKEYDYHGVYKITTPESHYRLISFINKTVFEDPFVLISNIVKYEGAFKNNVLELNGQ